MTTISISLSDDLQQFVKVQAQAGQFSSPGDYIRSLVEQARQNKDSLELLLQEGLDSGEPVILDAFEWRSIRDEVRERIQK